MNKHAILCWCDRGVLGLHASASLECGSSKHAYHLLAAKLKRKCDRDLRKYAFRPTQKYWGQYLVNKNAYMLFTGWDPDGEKVCPCS